MPEIEDATEFQPSIEESGVIRDLDNNPQASFGLTFPLSHDTYNGGFFPAAKSLLEQASSNLRNLLLTNKGERVGQPEFGSRLSEVLFEFQDASVKDKIEASILEAVEQWLPYITIQDIFVSSSNSDIDRNVVIVQIEFTVDLSDPDQVQSLTFNFET